MGFIDTLKGVFGKGEAVAATLPGRNDPCWCNSGKKYKHCHLESDQKRRSAAVAKNACKTPA